MKRTSRDELIEQILARLKKDRNIRAIFTYGSTARGDAHEHSDLDLLVIVRKKHRFVRYHGPLLVEVSAERLGDLSGALRQNPPLYYAFGELRALHDPEHLAQKVRARVRAFGRSYRATPLLRGDLFIQLQNLQGKISRALREGDLIHTSFLSQEAMGKFVEALCAVNDAVPFPQSSAATDVLQLRRVPRKFPTLWRTILTGTTEKRARAVLRLVGFLLPRLAPAMRNFPQHYKPLHELLVKSR